MNPDTADDVADAPETTEPAAAAAAAETAAAAASPDPSDVAAPDHVGTPDSPGCDVLMADDSGPSREILSAILRNFAQGLTLAEARNGIDAVQAWFRLRPRITLLDLDMPGTDGLAALQQIRAADPQAFVAIVSGSASADHVRRALELGANGFVVKPYKPQRILDLLERYARLSGTALGG